MAQGRLGFWRRFVVLLVLPSMHVWTKRTWSGQEHIPPSGGIIIASNHLSHFDPLVVAHFVYKAGRWPRFLAKASIFKVPVAGFLLRKTLQIPVERGSVEAAKSLDTLIDALNRGGAVVIYPEGTTTRSPELWPMSGKTGAARLALITGAPVIPMATDGAQQVYDPRTQKFRFRPRVPVKAAAGKPVDLSRWEGEAPSRAVLDQMTDAIMADISALVGRLRDESPPPIYRPPVRKAAPGSAG